MSDVLLSVKNVSKCFEIYKKPIHRLYQTLFAGSKKFYREFWALRDISFDLKKGECIGILGRNGAGKSTLLQVVTGVLRPTVGSVVLNGRVAALLELGSGFNPEFTGRENVYMNASILGLTREEIDARYADIVKFADIGDFINQPVKTYSSGMTVRLAFAVVAHVDADILIVDEALSVGDAFFQQKCMRFIRKFKEEHTILFVSHDTGAVLNLCTKAVLLEEGRMVAAGDPTDVSKTYLKMIFEGQANQTGAAGTHDDHQGEEAMSDNADVMLREKDDCDIRDEFLRTTTLRNDIRIFEFKRDERFVMGAGGAKIQDARLYDDKGGALRYVVGGEQVHLKITVKAEKDIISPIVGFHIKDRLGQELLGDNTYLTYYDCPFSVAAGEKLIAHFAFKMPVLKKGDYVFDFAIAAGTQVDHVQLDWVENALAIESISSHVGSLVGLTMRKIELIRSK